MVSCAPVGNRRLEFVHSDEAAPSGTGLLAGRAPVGNRRWAAICKRRQAGYQLLSTRPPQEAGAALLAAVEHNDTSAPGGSGSGRERLAVPGAFAPPERTLAF
jgi:hypothetical protein